MRKSLMIALIALIFLVSNTLIPCTVFYAAMGGMVLAGNNEDGGNPETRILFFPPEEGKYGRVYFTYNNLSPQGGMNDQGLFFDHTATKPLDVVLSKDKETPRRNIIDEVMETCATVEEALKVYDKYNLQFMRTFQTILGDKTGDSAIIEGDVIIRIKGDYQVSTNFHLSKVKSGKYPCERYNIATEMLESADDISVDFFRRILAAVHQEGRGKTLYSNIYDLKRGIIYVYHFHNYENVVEIDLKEELKKGKQTLNLPSLFPKTFAADAYMKDWPKELERKKVEVEEKKAARINPNVDPSTYKDYVGRYVISDQQGSPITIMQEEDKLYARVSGRKIELLPESEGRFFNIILQVSWRIFITEFTVVFLKEETGQVSELEISYADEIKISARKDH